MVTAVYEHIVIILLVGVIFVGAVLALPAINYSSFQSVDQQQLKNTALNAFTSMLLGVGSPPNWGSTFPFDQNNVETFGLAYSNPFSKFVADPDKVQRLDPYNPGFIEYDRVLNLLNLREYGFQLSIYRPFKVNWNLDITSQIIKFSVTVTRTQDMAPIPNAQVTVTTIATAANRNTDDLLYVYLDPSIYVTNSSGSCEGFQTINLSGYSIETALAIMTINVHGMYTTVVAHSDDSMTKHIKINTFGDTITLSLPDELIDQTSSERRIRDISAYDFENLYQLFDGSSGNPKDTKITQGEGYQYWSMDFPGIRTLNPTVLLFVMELTLKNPPKGQPARTYVLIAGPFSFGDPEKIFEFGPQAHPENIIATMRRFMVISDMTYVIDIVMWQEK
jgi:hypothetical protein